MNEQLSGNTLTPPMGVDNPTAASVCADVVAAETLADAFYKLNTEIISEDGIFPTQAFARALDGHITLMAYGAEGARTAERAMEKMLKYLIRNTPEEMIFGTDQMSPPSEGAELPDFLAVFHYRLEEGWRFGVLQYQHEPRIVRPIDWEHPYWAPELRAQTLRCFNYLLADDNAAFAALRAEVAE